MRRKYLSEIQQKEKKKKLFFETGTCYTAQGGLELIM
jgi:hypothetical protein